MKIRQGSGRHVADQYVDADSTVAGDCSPHQWWSYPYFERTRDGRPGRIVRRIEVFTL
jgi:hypothetical protein